MNVLSVNSTGLLIDYCINPILPGGGGGGGHIVPALTLTNYIF